MRKKNYKSINNYINSNKLKINGDKSHLIVELKPPKEKDVI